MVRWSALILIGAVCCGCASRAASRGPDADLSRSIDRYARRQSNSAGEDTAHRALHTRPVCDDSLRKRVASGGALPAVVFTSGAAPIASLAAVSVAQAANSPQSDSDPPAPRLPTYVWQDGMWKQASHEVGDFIRRGVWHGYRVVFTDAENLLALAGAMGASVAIRETGVDQTVRERIRRHRQLGEADEPIQLLGNPATHFAAAGVLWLGSAVTEDAKTHELARTLGEALAVNGATTVLLKAATNTRNPSGDRFSWPSGHTSSAFTVAAVLNEHYGPWVGVPSLALAGLVGYQRLDSREHDLSDVVFGGVLGYVVGSSIARDGKARFPELWGMQVVPYNDPETGAAGIALWRRF